MRVFDIISSDRANAKTGVDAPPIWSNDVARRFGSDRLPVGFFSQRRMR